MGSEHITVLVLCFYAHIVFLSWEEKGVTILVSFYHLNYSFISTFR